MLRRSTGLAFSLAASLAPIDATAQETFARDERPRTVRRAAGLHIEVIGNLEGFSLDFRARAVEPGLEVASLALARAEPAPPPRLTLEWSLPSHDVAGRWMTGRDSDKSVRPDWSGGRLQSSMFAREAPVSCLFGSEDQNVMTFAVSDALNTVRLGSGVREEDGLIYSQIVLFDEPREPSTEYAVELRLDRRPVRYWTALAGVAAWWAAQPGYEPAGVPEPAREPVYSTWYNYHQNVSSSVLLEEVAIARELGFESIIVDDGWQTTDSGRGYAYTGDWQPERMPDMKEFVAACHEKGVKVLLWYAVPFVGRHSSAAERFRERSLRFDERLGAYVVDPRFPEVRQHQIDLYRQALADWDLDGFKLDFIGRLIADDDTVLEATGGRDHASVNEATDRMLTDVLAALAAVKPDVMVEFRQPYVGPLIRKYGNMLRASDCPNQYRTNRVRTTDLRLLAGSTSVHADMVMWHYAEPVEKAALQLANVLFAVPQVSVRLREIPDDHLEMVRFYVSYWKRNRSVLLDGAFEAEKPADGYPVLRAHTPEKQIVGVYADAFVKLDGSRATAAIDVVNGGSTPAIILLPSRDLGRYRFRVRDCRGREVGAGETHLSSGAASFDVPVSGLLTLERLFR